MEVNYVITYSTFLTICTCIYSPISQVIKTNILLSVDTISRPDQLIKNFWDQYSDYYAYENQFVIYVAKCCVYQLYTCL